MKVSFRKVLALALAVLTSCLAIPFGAMVTADVAVISKDFEDGQQFFNSDCSLAVVEDGGSKVLHFDTSSHNWSNIWTYVDLESNVDYQVTFRMKANIVVDMWAKFHLSSWSGDFSTAAFKTSTEWTEYNLTLNSQNQTNGIFMFQAGTMASAGLQVYLDDVVLAKAGGTVDPETPIDPVEPVPGTTGLVVNGDFETGNTNGWQTYQSTAVAAKAAKTGNYGLHVVGNGGWGGLGNQTITGLELGKYYRISVWYKALSNGVNIQLCAGANDSGAKLAYVYGTSTGWTELAVEFEATTTTVFLTLVGAGNNQATEMYIDDVSLTEVVLGGNDNDPNLKLIEPLMENIKTQGRAALVRGTLMLDFSISGVEFELDCAGDVYATFNAGKLADSGANGGVYFTIVVDGVSRARDYCRITSVGETKIKLAEGLSTGKHTFAIYRQTEHQYGEVGICALSYDGAMLDKPAKKDLYVEFIGDSISCGFGNLGSNAQGDGSALWADGTKAYPFLTAQALGADWSNVSWSGIGCKYSYGNITMQDVYPLQRYNYDKTAAYDFSNQPDIVVLALGTNDNSQAPNNTAKREGMVEMLEQVREKNPTAPIVWIYGMMTRDVDAMVREIVEEFGGAEAGYYACSLTQNNAGGGYHPSLAGQQTFANELVAFILENGLADPAEQPDVPQPPQPPQVDDCLVVGGQTSRMEMNSTALGLAFRFDMTASGVTMDEDCIIDLSAATVSVDGTEYRLLEMGAILSADAGVGLSPDKMTDENLSGITIKVVAERAFKVTEDTASFAVRLTNIPLDKSDAIIYARPYYVYEVEGAPVMVYGDIYLSNYDNYIENNDAVLDWD